MDLDCEHEKCGRSHVLRDDALIERVVTMASAIGDPGRLRLLELLFDGPHCVSELADESGDSMSAISQRLKILHNAKLVSRERDGKHVYYALADDHVHTIIEQLFVHSEE